MEAAKGEVMARVKGFESGQGRLTRGKFDSVSELNK